MAAFFTAMFLLLSMLNCAAAQLDGNAAKQMPSQQLCERLRDVKVPASAIGLPTTGARVLHSKLTHAGASEYCKVLGEIRPVDPDAQSIRFEANLPTNWNGKAVQFGGAVFDGWLAYSNGRKQPTMGLKGGSTPLQQGYVTFGSDSGHHKRHLFLPDAVNLLDSSFASNAEERNNFSRDSLKKTHDVVVSLAILRYGQQPLRTFFLGSSTGGHEALMVAQNWPTDYDGVLSGYPSWEGVELVLELVRTSRALYAKGGFLPRSATKLLARSVLHACDGLDGVVDGLVSNTSACHFDPAVLLCTVNARRGCLSSQQLITVQAFATEQRTVEPLSQGLQRIPGYNVLCGADLTATLGLLHKPLRHPKIFLNSLQYVVGSHAVQSFLAEDQNFNALNMDPSTGAPYADKLLPGSREYDAVPDLSEFAAHGGKLLLVHGITDVIIPTNSSVMYYKRLQTAMGQATMQSFMRFYLIPGFGHGEGKFEAGFDSLGMLDRWVSTGEPDSNPTVQDKTRAGHGRTRPLCAYPSWPKYNGGGDKNRGSSYSCSHDGAETQGSAEPASEPDE